jgi:import inner membrane translocase subunit TIM17
MWGGIFSMTDCALISFRRMDDWKNAVVAGGITGGFLAIRGGLSVALKQAAIGAMILAMIEGVSNLFMAFSLRQQHQMMRDMQAAELARMQQMTKVGGENPYEVGFNKDV